MASLSFCGALESESIKISIDSQFILHVSKSISSLAPPGSVIYLLNRNNRRHRWITRSRSSGGYARSTGEPGSRAILSRSSIARGVDSDRIDTPLFFIPRASTCSAEKRASRRLAAKFLVQCRRRVRLDFNNICISFFSHF